MTKKWTKVDLETSGLFRGNSGAYETPEKGELLEAQLALEELYHKHQEGAILKEQFSVISEDKFIQELLTHMSKYKKLPVPVIIGIMSPKWGTVQEVASMVEDAVKDDYADYDLNADRIIAKYNISDDVQSIIDRFMFPLPMVTPPVRIFKNIYGFGYHDRKGAVITGHDSLYPLWKDKETDLCLDHLNKANSIPLSLNLAVLRSEEGNFIEPSRKKDEEWADYQKRIFQAKKFRNVTEDVMEGLLGLSPWKDDGGKFWLCHKYDTRGRYYSHGYHVNTQGDAYRKAVISFYDKKVISDDKPEKTNGFTPLSGKEYMICHAACKTDKKMEKETWETRLKFFQKTDFDNPDVIKNAEDPVGLRAALLALESYTKEEASGAMISLDAPSSGLQLLAVMSGCEKSFSLCGGNPEIRDAYKEIFKSFLGVKATQKQIKNCIMTALYGSEKEPKGLLGEEGKEKLFAHMNEKCPGAWSLNEGFKELWNMLNDRNNYSWTLPDGFCAYAEAMSKQTMFFEFMGADYQVVQDVRNRPEFHKGLGPNLIHSVDGFIAREMLRRCYYDKEVIRRVLDLITTGGKFSAEGKSCDMVEKLINLYHRTGFLSARILDYIHYDTIGILSSEDITAIAEMIMKFPEEPFPMVIVHDCFRCHPNDGNDVRIQYANILSELSQSDLLSTIVEDVAERYVPVQKFSGISENVFMEADYLLG